MLNHFGEYFWCPLRWQGQKYDFQVILNDFLDGQDPFTKSGGHARSLRPEVWNFAWDLVWPIHMPYKNTGSIREKKIILVHPKLHAWFHKVLAEIFEIKDDWYNWSFHCLFRNWAFNLEVWDSQNELIFQFYKEFTFEVVSIVFNLNYNYINQNLIKFSM